MTSAPVAFEQVVHCAVVETFTDTSGCQDLTAIYREERNIEGTIVGDLGLPLLHVKTIGNSSGTGDRSDFLRF